MKSHFYGITFELGSITYTGLDVDGYPQAQHDGLGEDPKIGSYELHHPFGFMSRPRDPDCDKDGKPLQGKSCNALIGKIGNETHLFLCSDPRYIPDIPQLKKGGAAMYCAAGSFDVFDGENGTKTTYVPVPGGKAHILTTGIDGNKDPFIGIEHCDGMAVTMLKHSLTLKNASGSVYIELKDDGVVINGNLVLAGGATIGDPVGATPVALAEALDSYLSALESGISSAIAAVGAGMLANGATGQGAFEGTRGLLAELRPFIAAKKTNAA